MARKPNACPSYLLHQPTGQARVRINGKDHYLGEFGSDASRILYGKLIAQQAGGLPVDPIAPSNRGSLPRNESDDPGPSVSEICLVFLRHAETHYVKHGKQTSEVHILKSVIQPLKELYGLTPANEFGPLALKAVRTKMIDAGWARGTINAGMSRIRRIFKHAIANELIDASVLVKLQTLAPLLAGRTQAHDNAPRTAVPEQSLERVRKEVSPLVRDLIDLQNLTGARSGELLSLTPVMIDTSGTVWSAELHDHKTLHHGQRRVLHFGPKAKKILRKHLKRDPDGPLFPITGAAYRRAITRACERLKIPRWVPHQLRHSAATKVREAFGLEHAQAVLGHSKASMSEHYAKLTGEKAAEVAKRLG